MPLLLMATVNDTNGQRGEMERKLQRMMVLQQVNRLETKENGTYEIQEHIETQKYNKKLSYQRLLIKSTQKEAFI